MAQTIKNLSAMQETWVRSLGRENALEKGMATHSSILARRIPQTEEPGGLQSVGSQRVGRNWVANTFSFTFNTNSTLVWCAFLIWEAWRIVKTPFHLKYPFSTVTKGWYSLISHSYTHISVYDTQLTLPLKYTQMCTLSVYVSINNINTELFKPWFNLFKEWESRGMLLNALYNFIMSF